VWLEALLQPPLGGRAPPLPIPAFITDLPGFGFPVRQVEDIKDTLQDLRRPLEEVLAL
jgi:hypothetical protein